MAPLSRGDADRPYTLIRSRRRTIAVQVTDAGVIVRAPLRTPKRDADAFVKQHEDWIAKQLLKRDEQRQAAQQTPKLTSQELSALYDRAREVIPARAAHYAALLGESFGRVTVRCQRTRWGSCSTKRNLNFNCLLMLAPPEVLDAVVIHEVCHLREMNHSAVFYSHVLRLCPDYRRRDKWLRDNGRLLLARLPDGA